MLQKINEFIENRISFAFETTLSGKNYFELIKDAKRKGFTVTLFFVYLESFDLAIERVALRVKKGGHKIPNSIIERRYHKGLKNLNQYLLIADEWYILNNSESSYKFIAQLKDRKEEVFNFEQFNFINNYGK